MQTHCYFGTAFCLVILMRASSVEAQGIWATDTSAGFIARYGHTASVVNDKIVVISGNNGDYDSLEIFDPITHVWSKPNVTGYFSSYAFGTSCVMNNKIFFFGGHSIYFPTIQNRYFDTVFVFDPATNTWSIPTMSGSFTPREMLSSCVVDGKIYAIGGHKEDASSNYFYSSAFEVLDPTTNTWSTPVTKSALVARTGHTSSVVNGKIYVIGGESQLEDKLPNQVFDPSTNTWSNISSVGFTHRRYLTASVVNGKIYTIGGTDLNGISALSTLEVYDPASDTWSTPTTTGALTRRMWLSSSVVNGKIYAIGGYTPHTELRYNEVFTPDQEDNVSSVSSSSIIQLSPNPTDGIVTVHAESTSHVTLENLLGERVLEVATPRASAFTLDLTKLPAGIYFARFEMAGGAVEMRKIVKE